MASGAINGIGLAAISSQFVATSEVERITNLHVGAAPTESSSSLPPAGGAELMGPGCWVVRSGEPSRLCSKSQKATCWVCSAQDHRLIVTWWLPKPAPDDVVAADQAEGDETMASRSQAAGCWLALPKTSSCFHAESHLTWCVWLPLPSRNLMAAEHNSRLLPAAPV
jgi:hypothetical protein